MTGPPSAETAPARPRGSADAPLPLPMLILRSGIGGAFMGLANLVPGISGGTMLLACGVYTRFVGAISELTRLRPTRAGLVTLACVIGAAGAVIVLLARLAGDLIVNHRWVMFSLFIGLTLGGVPLVWKRFTRRTPTVWLAVGIALLLMAALALVQAQDAGGASGDATAGPGRMLLAGVAGASAMILPGISGAYLLLLLKAYVPITRAIADVKTALGDADLAALWSPAMQVVLPVGVGVVLGVVVVANLVRWLLARAPNHTLGVLLGLLLGAVFGLWPFQQGVPPEPGDTLKGQTVILVDNVFTFEETDRPIAADDYPVRFFTPSVVQVLVAIVLAAVGLAATLALGLLDPEGGQSGSDVDAGAGGSADAPAVPPE